jgi:hypothetical protein
MGHSQFKISTKISHNNAVVVNYKITIWSLRISGCRYGWWAAKAWRPGGGIVATSSWRPTFTKVSIWRPRFRKVSNSVKA